MCNTIYWSVYWKPNYNIRLMLSFLFLSHLRIMRHTVLKVSVRSQMVEHYLKLVWLTCTLVVLVSSSQDFHQIHLKWELKFWFNITFSTLWNFVIKMTLGTYSSLPQATVVRWAIITRFFVAFAGKFFLLFTLLRLFCLNKTLRFLSRACNAEKKENGEQTCSRHFIFRWNIKLFIKNGGCKQRVRLIIPVCLLWTGS